MLEFFSDPNNAVMTFVAALVGGNSIYAVFQSIIASVTGKKYTQSVAQANYVDSQVKVVDTKMDNMTEAMGCLVSMIVAAFLGSKGLSPEVKAMVVQNAKKIETLTDVKLDTIVTKAFEVISNITGSQELDSKKDEILKKTANVQVGLDIVNQTSQELINSLEI